MRYRAILEGDLAERIKAGKSTFLGIVVYDHENDRIQIEMPETVDREEAAAMLAKHGIRTWPKEELA